MASSLASKLQLKPGRSLAVVHPPAGYRDLLAAELGGIKLLGRTAKKADAVLIFVTKLAEAGRLGAAGAATTGPGGAVWFCYPKGGSKVKTDVHRDRLWEALKPAGWRPARLIALDETWSAMRFRSPDKAGK